MLNPASALIQSVTYNPNGTAQRSDRATGAPAQTFGYDSTLRLNSAAIVQNLSSANDVSWSYARNPASQITTETRDNDSYAWTDHVDVTRTYTANGLNQYTAAGSASFTYDANGNLTSDGSTTYIYDIENRLVSAADGTTTITLRYDPMGRLYELAENGTPTRRFLHDGDALVGEYDAAGTLLARHVHGPDGSADDPLASFAGTTSTDLASAQLLYRDPRGSIVLMSNAAGTDVDLNTYDEYGIPGAGNTGRFQYTGQVWLDEIGMYYYKARIYSPTLGRFLQTDPIGYEDQFNLYAYVGNDPINGVDPTGMTCNQAEAGGTSHCDGEVNEEDTKLQVQHMRIRRLPVCVIGPSIVANRPSRHVCC